MPVAPAATKKATNITLSADVLAEAKALGINISRACDDALRRPVKAERGRQWRKNNQAAIAAHNDRVERHGVFSDGLRSF